MHISNHRHAELFFYGGENIHALFQTYATVRMNGGAVGLVERGFEYIGYIQFAGDFYIVCASVKGGVEIFKHVDAAKKGERGIVGKGAVIEIH